MSYHKSKEKIKEFNKKWITIIGIVFIAMVGLKLLGKTIEDNRYSSCYQYPYRQISGYLECKKHSQARLVIWVKATELQKERKRLFTLVQQGSGKAKKKLNKLNYDEENRKHDRN